MSTISAEKERKMEHKVAGGMSARQWQHKFILEFALMARKLRKTQDGKDDAYSPIINRSLLRYDQAIKLLERSPQMALEFGEEGGGMTEIIAFIEAKAEEAETAELYKEPIEEIRKVLPGARLNQIVKSAAPLGGLVVKGTQGQTLWTN